MTRNAPKRRGNPDITRGIATAQHKDTKQGLRQTCKWKTRLRRRKKGESQQAFVGEDVVDGGLGGVRLEGKGAQL